MVVVPDPTNEISFVVGLGFLMPSRDHLPVPGGARSNFQSETASDTGPVLSLYK
jgi:hypothetical protein